MLKKELPGKRKNGRPQRRFMDAEKEDMQKVDVRERKITCLEGAAKRRRSRRRRSRGRRGGGTV